MDYDDELSIDSLRRSLSFLLIIASCNLRVVPMYILYVMCKTVKRANCSDRDLET